MHFLEKVQNLSIKLVNFDQFFTKIKWIFFKYEKIWNFEIFLNFKEDDFASIMGEEVVVIAEWGGC